MFVRRGVRFFATECKRKTTTWDPLHSLDLNHQSLVLLEKCNSRHQFKQILANIMRVNLICDTFPMSRLILFSAITYPDNIDLAKLLFRNFTPNPNVFVYNTMISSALSKKECFGLYGSMVRHGVCPDRQTFLYLMKVTNFLSEVKQIHCHVTVSGVLSEGNNYYLWNSLVKLYMELGGLGYAEKVFDEMPERDVSSFNTMIVGYAKKGYCLEAMKLYYKMVGDGIEPDEYAVLGLLVCCGRLSDVRLGKGVHGWIERRKPGSSSNLILWNAVLDMYFKCRDSGFAKRVFDVMTKKDTCSWNTMVGGFVKLEDMEAAREVFDQMPRRDLVSWNSLLLGYSKKGCDQRVVRELVYEMLIVEKVVPDGVTFVSLISGAANNGELSQGRWAHGFMIRLGLQIDAFLGSALVDMYCKCGSIERAFMVFKTVAEKDVTLWTTMISGTAFHGNGKQALELFQKMQEEGVTPNKVTLLAVLTACSHSGLVEEGLHVFNHMKEAFGFDPETEHYGSLVDLLCRAGRVEEAKDIVQKKMPMRPSQSMWGSILSACRGGEDIETAEMALTELLKLEPDKEGGYVLLSNIYAAARRFGYSDKTREAMESRLSLIDLNRRKKMQPYGIQSMLKEGYRHLSGLDEAVIKNIEACKELSTITRTSLGPNGMNKMVINHLDKLFVTNDAATIVNELEIQHPAAKILVLAAKAQQEEIGDGANLTISFAGELLQNAEELIRMGLHPSEIISGYNKAIIKVVEILEQLVESGSETMDVRDKDEVVSRMRAAVASKQFGQEEIICSLVADACIQVCPKNPTNFNVDNVRVAKLLGGGLHNSCIVRGMVLRSDAVGSIKRMEKAKVAVFAGGVDTTATETKGTVLIHSAEQLENYAKTEEAKVEELIKAVAESGAKVIVSGGSVGEMALHFCERYKIMVLKISSKFELRRFCRAAGAVAHLKLSRPSPDDLGYVDSISVEEIGGVTVTIARNEQGGNSISTVVLRGSTDSILDDLERAVDDGVNTYKAMCRDSRIVPGAAATEIELAQRLKEYANAETGLDKYAITKYAESFEFVPKTLADNAGLNAMEIIASLYTGHGSGNTKLGIDLEEGACKDVSETKVWDLFATKLFALKYASDAACTVLRVDQIIMAKQAGGPRRDAAQAAGAGAEED